MKVLDLFSGTGGWSEAFLRRGHDVIRIDFDPRFRSVPKTMTMDLLSDLVLPSLQGEKWDVILASPPCQCFSLASIRHHFDAWSTCRNCGEDIRRIAGEQWSNPTSGFAVDCEGNHKPDHSLRLYPASEKAVDALALLNKAITLIAALQPDWWWIENPRGGMKHFITQEPTTVWYCQYGDRAAKPTHLWGRWPEQWVPRPKCFNSNPRCPHEKAPRGSRTGTQGKSDAAERAVVPYELSRDVALACEAAWAQERKIRWGTS